MKNILVFRTGFLGDNLISIPAFWCLKENFPGFYFIYLGHKAHERILGEELLKPTNIFNEYISYPYRRTGGIKEYVQFFISLLKLFLKLRSLKITKVAYFADSRRKNKYRDFLFFRLCGIKEFIAEKIEFRSKTITNTPLEVVNHESVNLLNRLKNSGLIVRDNNFGNFDLRLTSEEVALFSNTQKNMTPDGSRLWVGIGPKSTKQVNDWPQERYFELIYRLIEAHDIWPVVFGSPSDSDLANQLIKMWGRGYNFSGIFSPRVSVIGLKKCTIFIGNDTGTIHLAAAASIPCVGIYSSRDYPGMWYPYGRNHKVFRTNVECEGCGLSTCVINKKKCILSINVDDVFDYCTKQIKEKVRVK